MVSASQWKAIALDLKVGWESDFSQICKINTVIPKSVFGPASSFPNFCSLMVSLSGGSKKSTGLWERASMAEAVRNS